MCQNDKKKGSESVHNEIRERERAACPEAENRALELIKWETRWLVRPLTQI